MAEGGPWDGWFRARSIARRSRFQHLIAAFLYPMTRSSGVEGDRRISSGMIGGVSGMWYPTICGIFHSALGSITRAAHIWDEEAFTDHQSRQILERILFETSPEAMEIPYGAIVVIM